MGKLAISFAAALTIATPALAETTAADADAARVAATLSRHLNKHGKRFVGVEANRLAIGDASESGAKDDVREACPQPTSCLDTGKLSPDEVMAAMLVLSAGREQTLLEQQIAQMTARNTQLKQLVSELEKAADDGERARIKGEIDKLNADSQLDMIRLQQLVNKRNQAYDMLTNMMQTYQKTLDGIVRNMR
ncbi:MAG: hypothetical protein JOZ72_08015 [Alphaproteobacteria bacterium]|nr:hypothetical protein [Alphaproteobacteria bacterium]